MIITRPKSDFFLIFFWLSSNLSTKFSTPPAAGAAAADVNTDADDVNTAAADVNTAAADVNTAAAKDDDEEDSTWNTFSAVVVDNFNAAADADADADAADAAADDDDDEADSTSNTFSAVAVEDDFNAAAASAASATAAADADDDDEADSTANTFCAANVAMTTMTSVGLNRAATVTTRNDKNSNTQFIHSCSSDQQQNHIERAHDYQLHQRCIYRCLLYTSPSPRDVHKSRMPSSA